MKRKKICIVATVPYALIMFMKPHIDMFASKYNVTLIANGAEKDMQTLLNEHVRFIPLNIERNISLLKDVRALFSLLKIFRREKFDVVHSIGPKSALLAMFSALLAGVPYRIHTFTGQVWATRVGVSKFVLKTFDRVIALCATGLLADSFSQRQFLVNQNIVAERKIVVLGHGSVCGVDVERFKPNIEIRTKIRNALGIPQNAIVFLFLGRLNSDKGIRDLAEAFSSLATQMPNARLLVVGPDEGGMDKILQWTLEKCRSQFHRVGYTSRPEDYMASADIFCLPSYREGFGSVIIEAAATGVPSVASKIYGLMDAVVDGETGILHPPKDIDEIKLALLQLSNDSFLRQKMAAQAKVRVQTYFTIDILTSAMREYYSKLLG